MASEQDSWVARVVDEAVARWSDIVVPIYVESPKSKKDAIGVGSAFTLQLEGNLLLVTAKHVLPTANRSRLQVANICGKAVDLGGLKFVTRDALDIAVAPLTAVWLQEKGLKSLKAATFARGEAAEQTRRAGVFVTIGYPSSKNHLRSRYGKVDRYCHSISLSAKQTDLPKTPILNPLVLHYDQKRVFNSSGVGLGVQVDLYGMSGGPCFELLFQQQSDGTQKVLFDAVGVITEFHPKNDAIIAARLSELFCGLL